KDFFTDCGNGLVYSWDHKDHFGSLLLPPLKMLVENYQGWKELVLWMDDYAFPHVDDPKLGKKTYQRMKRWLPLISEGNGDGFCIDCGSKTAPVVFHRHDWYDGGSGENGHLVADNLFDFVQSWSRVCFISPKNCYWPETFSENGISWTSQFFEEKFIIPS